MVCLLLTQQKCLHSEQISKKCSLVKYKRSERIQWNVHRNECQTEGGREEWYYKQNTLTTTLEADTFHPNANVR